MQLIRGLVNLNHQADACVATIGNFDGVHLGHQAIIKRVIQHARRSNHQSCVILFEPHPKEAFMGDSCPARITNFTEKYLQLSALGVDKLLVLKFNKALCQMKATDFIQTVLVENLKIKHLVVGDDFQFGYKRQGNFKLLKEYGKDLYTVEPTPTVIVKDLSDNPQEHRASSTLVRNALADNDLEFAKMLLTRRYAMTGKVGYGQQLGRTIGFPTANIALNRRKPTLSGVFLVRAKWTERKAFSVNIRACWGVANCGSRPTVDGKGYRLEVHLLDVDADLYGIELKVEFYAFIRKEMKFGSVEILKAQINKDVKKAQKLVSERLIQQD
ncbi:MAG: bifunctional riboflavin kinase/FMN adenylyltransferase [Gammaproteobacteria bacterium]|nr:MAG: bifunctional riboflavin kinase/FMN adenylyltransferase [Gammaproteobacteria bacterium]